MFDIPNFVSLPIEIGVAVLILLMDKRQRKRERESTLRFHQQQDQFRQSEIRQRERFNNFIQESSKRQIMLLESIMATLDKERVNDFKTEVGSRYAEELSNDMNDLDELLDRKSKSADVDPELEADIESKIDEIESGKDFVEHFLPKETIDSISNLANSATNAYRVLRDLPEILKSRFPDDEGNIKIRLEDREFQVNPNDEAEVGRVKEEVLSNYKVDRVNFLESLNKQLQDTLQGVKRDIEQNLPATDSTTAGKLMDVVKSSLLQTMGLTKKENDDENNVEKEEDSDSSA